MVEGDGLCVCRYLCREVGSLGWVWFGLGWFSGVRLDVSFCTAVPFLTLGINGGVVDGGCWC